MDKLEMKILNKIDKPIFICLVLLLIVGLMMIYSSTYKQDISFFYKQLIWVFISIIAFFLIQYIPLKMFYISSYLLFSFSLMLLGLLKWFNASYVERWIDIGFASIQPSEFAKLTLILTLARYLSNRYRDVNKTKVLAVSTLITLIPFLLVFIQPDIGTAIIYLIILVVSLYLAEVKVIYIFVLLTPLISLILSFFPFIWILYLFILGYILYLGKINILNVIKTVFLNVLMGGLSPILWNLLKEYQKVRILSYFAPNKDIHGFGWNLLQSKIAIGSGGFWGNGYLNGTQKGLDFIPQQHTDFIFSVIGEEFGFFGFLFISILLFIIVYRTVTLYPSIKSRFSKLLAGTIVTVTITQMLLNISMTIGIIPIVGIPLNFISYGGSSLLTSIVMFALLNKIILDRGNYW